MTIRVFLTWPQYFFIWEALGGGLRRAGEGVRGIIRLGSNLLLPSGGAMPTATPPHPLSPLWETPGTREHPPGRTHASDGSFCRGWLCVLLTSKKQFAFREQIFTSFPEGFFFPVSQGGGSRDPWGSARRDARPHAMGRLNFCCPLARKPLCFENQVCFSI